MPNNHVDPTEVTKKSWNDEEIEALMECWVNLSQSPDRGVNQSAEVFYGNIAQRLTEEPYGFQKRSTKACQTKISEVKSNVRKFQSELEHVRREPASGTSAEDEIKEVSFFLFFS